MFFFLVTFENISFSYFIYKILGSNCFEQQGNRTKLIVPKFQTLTITVVRVMTQFMTGGSN